MNIVDTMDKVDRPGRCIGHEVHAIHKVHVVHEPQRANVPGNEPRRAGPCAGDVPACPRPLLPPLRCGGAGHLVRLGDIRAGPRPIAAPVPIRRHPHQPPRSAARLEEAGSSHATRIKTRSTSAGNRDLQTVFPPDDNPQTFLADGARLPRANYTSVDLHDPAIQRLSGYVWNTWHLPELWGIEADADLSDPAAYPKWFTAALEAVQRHARDISVHVEVFSPFTHLMELFGYEQALMALVDAPKLCHEALTIFTRNVLAQVQVYSEHRPDAILVSSAFAGGGFISRQMYQEFVMPYENEVFAAIRNSGSKSYVHTCGAIGDRLDLMAQTAVDGIDTLDPPPLGTVDLAQAKAEYGRRFFFKGNLDAVNEMLYADDATFEQAVEDRLRIGKPGSGYILSSACSVAPHVKPERLKQLAEMAEQLGTY